MLEYVLILIAVEDDDHLGCQCRYPWLYNMNTVGYILLIISIIGLLLSLVLS